MSVYVCVPVLKRYDLLKDLVVSLTRSTVKPELRIIDNGVRGEKLQRALEPMGLPFEVYTPPEPLGVAASWNWFIQNVPEERVISNDDVVFAPDSLARLVGNDLALAWASGFSCFLIRDECVRTIGFFDETISPGYGYYEDDDYLQRLDGRGTRSTIVSADNVECGVIHRASSTLKAATPEEIAEHHRKFKIAQWNYVRKWGLEESFERERVEREMASR